MELKNHLDDEKSKSMKFYSFYDGSLFSIITFGLSLATPFSFSCLSKNILSLLVELSNEDKTTTRQTSRQSVLAFPRAGVPQVGPFRITAFCFFAHFFFFFFQKLCLP
jgi:hypothetical protein